MRCSRLRCLIVPYLRRHHGQASHTCIDATSLVAVGTDYFGGLSNQGLRIHIASSHVAISVLPNLAGHSLCEGSGHPLPMLGAACFYMSAIGALTHGDLCDEGARIAKCMRVLPLPSAKGHTAEDFSWRPVQTAC